MPELKSLDGWDESLKKEPDLKYYLEYDFYKIDNVHYHKPGLYGFNNSNFSIWFILKNKTLLILLYF